MSTDKVIYFAGYKYNHDIFKVEDNALKPYLPKVKHAIGSINSPMQCMMKGICAQCLCKHVDANGDEYFVYSCYNQDQDLDQEDFPHLNARLRQNTVQEKSNLWLDYLFEKQ